MAPSQSSSICGKYRPARDLDLVIETKVHGLNRKVSNLVNMAPRIRHDVVVLADSDMRVDPDYLSRVIAALEEPGVGAVTCLYYGVPVAGMWSSLSALAINAHFLPGVVFGLALGLARPCFGSTLALRRRDAGRDRRLHRLRRLPRRRLRHGAALRARGCTIAIPPFAVAHMCTRDVGARVLAARVAMGADDQEHRSCSVTRASIVAHPLPWALIAAAARRRLDRICCRRSPSPLASIAMPDGASAAGGASLRPCLRKRIGLCPRVTYCRSSLFVVSFLGRDVSWKGHRYRMVAGGSWVTDRGSHAP